MADHGVVPLGVNPDTTSAALRRRLVKVGTEKIFDTANPDFPGHYPDEDHSWNLESFESGLTIDIKSISDVAIEFDMVGVDASIANAIRRVLIAEVPTVTVEKVYIWNNTSIVHDEVLAHRIGLVPLAIDPRKVDYKYQEVSTDENTLVFKFVASCSRLPFQGPNKHLATPTQLYSHPNVTAESIEWVPKGQQVQLFGIDNPPRPVHPDILLAKLRPGQQIAAELHGEKGIGKDHAKFSPVATATYRLLPHIQIHKPIPPHLHEKFKSCFSPNVIQIKKSKKPGVEDTCVVSNPRLDTVSREVLRHSEFEGSVTLGRVRDHFIFNIESTGVYKPEELVLESCAVIRNKIENLKNALQIQISKSQHSTSMDIDT